MRNKMDHGCVVFSVPICRKSNSGRIFHGHTFHSTKFLCVSTTWAMTSKNDGEI